jgi:hypothetical protein
MPAYYKNQFRPANLGTSLPALSTELDSVRAYQFEVHFEGVPGADQLTLAAKQVSPIGVSVDDIEVHRVNEKFFYPGKPSPEEVTITFDDLYSGASQKLYTWFKTIYDNTTGTITTAKAQKCTVVQLDGDLNVVGSTSMYGVYPKGWKESEYNYSTANDFHTIEMTLRYDFADHKS